MSKEEFFIKKSKAFLTAPLRGYVSPAGREAIKRLEQVGFDSDLAFEIAASSIPEEEFYTFPEDEEDE